MEILEILKKAVDARASDVFLVAGLPVTFKCDGRQQQRQGAELHGRLFHPAAPSLRKTAVSRV